MNALCGCLLYTMPEADAFQSFCILMNDHMPAYFADNISGVYNGTHVFLIFFLLCFSYWQVAFVY